MKVNVLKNINKLNRKELKYAFNEVAKNLYYSTGEGLDFANNENKMNAINKELKRRKINHDKFIDEIEEDMANGKL